MSSETTSYNIGKGIGSMLRGGVMIAIAVGIVSAATHTPSGAAVETAKAAPAPHAKAKRHHSPRKVRHHSRRDSSRSPFIRSAAPVISRAPVAPSTAQPVSQPQNISVNVTISVDSASR